jgi:hypothetical protein
MHDWSIIKNHLLGLDQFHDASLDILKLQSQVLAMGNAKIQ